MFCAFLTCQAAPARHLLCLASIVRCLSAEEGLSQEQTKSQNHMLRVEGKREEKREGEREGEREVKGKGK